MFIIKNGYSHSYLTGPFTEDRLTFLNLVKCMEYAMIYCLNEKASMYVYRLIKSDRGFTIGSELIYTIHHPNQNLEILFPWNNVNN